MSASEQTRPAIREAKRFMERWIAQACGEPDMSFWKVLSNIQKNQRGMAVCHALNCESSYLITRQRVPVEPALFQWLL